jgi:glutathione S-transferase
MLTLYHHGASVCAAKVRLALYEKGIDYEGVYIHRPQRLGSSVLISADWY